jgi:hypothetical protein
MKKKDQISEREYQDHLQSLLNGALKTQLLPLRSLKTATKKRRALKAKVARNQGTAALVMVSDHNRLRDGAACSAAGVRKPPREETALQET